MAARSLTGAWNFRDVAESTAPYGAAVRPGRLFRSSELSRLDDGGRALLRDLGVTDVADLRSPREVQRRGPGLVPDGVDIHLLPFPDIAAVDADADAPHESAFRKMLSERIDGESVGAAAQRYMTEEYERFAGFKGAQRAVHRVITLLADGRPMITHCFAGKDRTGFTVALVLESVGIDRDAIMADYLRSNEAVAPLRARILEMIESRYKDEMLPDGMSYIEARLTDEVLGVREEYLDAARKSIEERYGSLGGYLRDAGVNESDVEKLRAHLRG